MKQVEIQDYLGASHILLHFVLGKFDQIGKYLVGDYWLSLGKKNLDSTVIE